MEKRSRLLTSILQVAFYLNIFEVFSEGNIQDNYIGCYYDDVNYQPAQQKISLQNSTSLTIELCIGQCLLQNSTYASLEISETCLCGNNFGVMLSDSSCNSLCPGNQSEYCGGWNGQRAFYSLYAVCEIGYYGDMCDQVCHCRRQAPCDRITGKCPNECEEKWFGTTCSNIQMSERYVGCFREDLPRAISSNYSTDSLMTVDVCSSRCILRNNSIAGLQAKWHCFCGESYAKYGPRNESDCSDSCPGNRSQKCGGKWANSVYSVCPAGYYGTKCRNQCHCFNNSRCVYLTGECNSTCKAGWTGNSCNIRDCRAKGGNCFQNETCATVSLNFATVTRCLCLPGFERKAFWEICRDIDECRLDLCDASTTDCTNTVASYTCTCKSGYQQYNETTCYDMDECRNDSLVCDIETELCKNTIGSYTCHCKTGYENTIFGNCTDVDECKSCASTCNPTSEFCVNNIGSYRCECKDGFLNLVGKCGELNGMATIGIILGTFLAISLLINAFFFFSRIKCAKPIKSEPGIDMTESDFQPRSIKLSDQSEMNCDEIPEPVGQSVYEQFIPEQLRIIQNPNSDYAELKLDDYSNVECSL